MKNPYATFLSSNVTEIPNPCVTKGTINYRAFTFTFGKHSVHR